MIKKLPSGKAMLPALYVLFGLANAQAAEEKGPAANLVLGGQIKLGLAAQQVSDSGRPGALPASRVYLAKNTSFFFLAGQEPLSEKLKTVFHLEWEFSANSGAQGVARSVFVGLDHRDLGRLLLGRQSVYFSHHWFVNDPHGAFDAAPSAANSLNVLGSINGANFAGGFLNNTVRYEAPNLHGFSGIATYSFDAEQANHGRNHTWYLGPTYTRGAFKLGYFHLVRNSQPAAAQTAGSLDQTADRFAMGYQWQDWQFGVVADRNRVVDRALGANQQRWAFSIPINYVWGRHIGSLTYGQAFSMRLNERAMAGSGAKMLSASYQYKMSRRTILDATFATLRNDRNGRYNFWLGNLSGASQLALADAGARVNMVYLGIKHMF